MHGFSFTPGSVVLVLHAHPDDETFATAAATSAARQAGCSVHLRIFTGGEGRTADLSPTGLVKARQHTAELLEQAAPYVGINDWNYLTRPGQWTDTPHDPSRTIAAARPHDLTTAARAAIDALRPDVILTVGRPACSAIRCRSTTSFAVSAAYTAEPATKTSAPASAAGVWQGPRHYGLDFGGDLRASPAGAGHDTGYDTNRTDLMVVRAATHEVRKDA